MTTVLSSILFTVLTFNAGLLRVAGVDIVPHVAERAQRLPTALVEELSQRPVSVLLLEEIWEDGHAQEITAALSPLGYHAFRPSAKNFVGMSSGLLLAVGPEFDLVEAGFQPFRQAMGIEAFAVKGIVWARIRSHQTGKELMVFGTHLAAVDTIQGKTTNTGEVSVALDQIRQLKALIAESAGQRHLPWVLAGDMNAGQESAPEVWAALTDGLDSAPDAVTWDSANPWVKTGMFPDAGTAGIDKVLWPRDSGWALSTSGVVFDQPRNDPLSDHFGLAATLQYTWIE